MTELDATDRKLLDLLQSYARITNAELAERVHLSASACHRRVRELEDAGIVSSYVTFSTRDASAAAAVCSWR